MPLNNDQKDYMILGFVGLVFLIAATVCGISCENHRSRQLINCINTGTNIDVCNRVLKETR